MAYQCCLCAPDKIREGRIRDGGGVPLCVLHFDRIFWSLRQSALSTTDTRPTSIIEQAFAHAMLAAVTPIAAAG
jgi:hypothetical protein